MKIFLQRDKSDVNTRFQVLDDRGELKYHITGRRNPSGESARIRNVQGDTLCKIRSLGFSALSVYSITASGDTIRLNVTAGAGRVSARFHGISFCIRGDVLAGSYDILDADTAVVCAVYYDFAKGTIQLTVNQTDREIFCIAAAACIAELTVDRVPALQMS